MVTSGTIQFETDYAELARRPLEAEQCALIVVDIQSKLLPPIWEKERLLRNSQLLIRLAGILKIPAIVSTQYAQGLGNTVRRSLPCCRTSLRSTRRCSPASAAMCSARC
jgi:hypothetical protein